MWTVNTYKSRTTERNKSKYTNEQVKQTQLFTMIE